MTDEDVRHREAIRALVTRYNINGDRARFAELAACFMPNGSLRYTGGGGEGREAIVAALTRGTARPGITCVRHNLTTMHIELAPDRMTGTGRIYFFVITNAGPDHAGVYVDRYAREGDDWFIAAREVRIDWRAATSLYGPGPE